MSPTLVEKKITTPNTHHKTTNIYSKVKKTEHRVWKFEQKTKNHPQTSRHGVFSIKKIGIAYQNRADIVGDTQ